MISQDLATLMTELGGVTKPVNANTDLKDHAHYLSTQLMNTRYVGQKIDHTRLHTGGTGCGSHPVEAEFQTNGAQPLSMDTCVLNSVVFH